MKVVTTPVSNEMGEGLPEYDETRSEGPWPNGTTYCAVRRLTSKRISLPDYHTQELEIVALSPHRRQLSTKVRLLLDMLIERFADERRWLDSMPCG